jgi:3'-5' exoribonuclease
MLLLEASAVKRLFVSDITKDVEVKDFFLVVKKGIYSSRNNTRYASVRLRDKTGSIEARIWDRADELSAGFDRNDIVYVDAKARSYQEQLQLNVTDIRKEARALSAKEIGEFYPETGLGIEPLKEAFFRITGGIGDVHLTCLFDELKKREEVLDRFFLLPASVGVHHISIGGLLEHSVAVAEMGRHAVAFTGGDPDIVTAGSLLHDIGKIDEITFKAGGFGYSDQGRLLGHITLGIMILDRLVSAIDGFPASLADVLKHIILSHHGAAEWGSPKKPMCTEALVVHYIDNLDAKVMGVKEHMDAGMEDERWSQFHRLYESRFYKIPER